MSNIPASVIILLGFLAGIGVGASIVLAKWNIVLSDENSTLSYRLRNRDSK